MAANGDLLALYLILATKFDKDGNSTLIWCYLHPSLRCTFNESEYLNGEIYPKIIEHFVSLCSNHNPGVHCCLIGDKLAAHWDEKVIKYALNPKKFKELA